MLPDKLRAASVPSEPNAWELAFATYTGDDQATAYLDIYGTGPVTSDLVYATMNSAGTKVLALRNTGIMSITLSTAWDGDTSVQSSGRTVAEVSSLQGIAAKPDGTKVYVVGGSPAAIAQYDLSTAWEIGSASYANTFSVASQTSDPVGVAFKSDGTKMYVLGGTSVYEYGLSTAWDTSTASYSQSYSVAGQAATFRNILLSSDDTKMYVFGGGVTGDIYQYALSTAGDVSTASFSKQANIYPGYVYNVFFVSDGSEIYINPQNDFQSIYLYPMELNTAWDFGGLEADLNYLSASINIMAGIAFKSDGTRVYTVQYNSTAIKEYTLSTAWDLGTATYVGFRTMTADSSLFGITFKPDGTKAYLVGRSTPGVYECNLSTAWDLSTLSYSQVLLTSAQDTGPMAVAFKPDGTKLYVTGSTADAIYEYDLSTAWDVSTASFQQSLSVSSATTTPAGLVFKPDGTTMLLLGRESASTDYDKVIEYGLSTAWDVSTATVTQTSGTFSYLITSFGMAASSDGTQLFIQSNSTKNVSGLEVDSVYSVQTIELDNAWEVDRPALLPRLSGDGPFTTYAAGPTFLAIKSDGTELYAKSANPAFIYTYALSTAGDISTGTLVSIAELDVAGVGFAFKSDGTKLYLGYQAGADSVREYNLSTAWDVSTATLFQSEDLSANVTRIQGLTFKPDGTKMFVTDDAEDVVLEYTLSTAWDVSTATFVRKVDVTTSGHATPKDIAFTSSGTTLLLADTQSPALLYFSLGEAWNLGTMSFVGDVPLYVFSNPAGVVFNADSSQLYTSARTNLSTWNIVQSIDIPTPGDVTSIQGRQLSLSGIEANPQGVYVKPDGTKLYAVGSSLDSVREYDLSTAWDISTASFVQSFSVLTQDNNPRDIFFKPDGNKMYICGDQNDDVYEYDLSTSWDISTASFLQSADIVSSCGGLYIKPDGTKLYISRLDDVYEYTLSTAWDVSTLTYTTFEPDSDWANLSALSFKPDGTKMYVSGNPTNLTEYDLSTAWDLTTLTKVYDYGSNCVGLSFRSTGLTFIIVDGGIDSLIQLDIT